MHYVAGQSSCNQQLASRNKHQANGLQCGCTFKQKKYIKIIFKKNHQVKQGNIISGRYIHFKLFCFPSNTVIYPRLSFFSILLMTADELLQL